VKLTPDGSMGLKHVLQLLSSKNNKIANNSATTKVGFKKISPYLELLAFKKN